VKDKKDYKAIIKLVFMIKAVILDWIGTLYQRDIGLFPDSEQTLSALQKKGVRMSLVSLTKNDNSRKVEIESSGLTKYFDHVVINKTKDASQYLMCMHLMNLRHNSPNEQISNRNTLLVDDRTLRGIKIGNELQCPTAWIRRGEYSHEIPNQETGQPSYTIETVSDILRII